MTTLQIGDRVILLANMKAARIEEFLGHGRMAVRVEADGIRRTVQIDDTVPVAPPRRPARAGGPAAAAPAVEPPLHRQLAHERAARRDLEAFCISQGQALRRTQRLLRETFWVGLGLSLLALLAGLFGPDFLGWR